VIFLTVGSALPFDRLVRMIDDIAPRLNLDEPLFAQIGRGRYHPRHFEYVDFLAKTDFNRTFEIASAVISHAGIGTIGKAMQSHKPILVLPRREAFGELVDDHQLLTAKKFEALGHILAFSCPEEFTAKLAALPSFTPKPRNANVQGISVAIEAFLAKV
jgi:beta-1,4-N-acetylglucosaminyltransferase